MLTVDRENILLDRVKRWDERAMEELVACNQGLVVSIARKRSNSGLSMLDIIGEGNFGLYEAIKRFDPKKEAKLSTYAPYWITVAIQKAVAKYKYNVSLPNHVQAEAFKALRFMSEFLQKHGREPTEAECFENTSVTQKTYNQMLNTIRSVSLDVGYGEEDEEKKYELVDHNPNPAEIAETNIQNKELLKLLEEILDDREMVIIRMRYGLGCPRYTLEQVAAEIGVTRERCRQIEEKVLIRLSTSEQLKTRVTHKEETWGKVLKYKLMVSNLGRTKIPQHKTDAGYILRIGTETVPVDKLVANAFLWHQLGNKAEFIEHKDGDVYNNEVANLVITKGERENTKLDCNTEEMEYITQEKYFKSLDNKKWKLNLLLKDCTKTRSSSTIPSEVKKSSSKQTTTC